MKNTNHLFLSGMKAYTFNIYFAKHDFFSKNSRICKCIIKGDQISPMHTIESMKTIKCVSCKYTNVLIENKRPGFSVKKVYGVPVLKCFLSLLQWSPCVKMFLTAWNAFSIKKVFFISRNESQYQNYLFKNRKMLISKKHFQDHLNI